MAENIHFFVRNIRCNLRVISGELQFLEYVIYILQV